MRFNRARPPPALAGSEAVAEIFEPATHVGSSLRAFSDGGSTPPASTNISVIFSLSYASQRKFDTVLFWSLGRFSRERPIGTGASLINAWILAGSSKTLSRVSSPLSPNSQSAGLDRARREGRIRWTATPRCGPRESRKSATNRASPPRLSADSVRIIGRGTSPLSSLPSMRRHRRRHQIWNLVTFWTGIVPKCAHAPGNL